MVKSRASFLQRLAYFLHPAKSAEEYIISPNGRVIAKFILKQGHISYTLNFDGKVVVKESRLGIGIRGTRGFGEGLSLVRMGTKRVDEKWETVWGEEREIRNNYNEKVFYLAENSGERRMFTIRFRVFVDGIGFRYEIPPQPSFSRIAIADELTEFNFDSRGMAYSIPANQPDRYEYNYTKRAIFELNEPVHTPLTIKTTNGVYASIHEAALYNYGEMTLKIDEWGALKSDICPLSDGMKAYVELPFNTPWRVVMLGARATDLVKNRIVLNLNDAPREDFSWVKPIKFIGIWWAMYVGEWTWAQGERHGASTENTLDYIREAKKLGMDGVLAEGWNDGWEGDWLQNGKYTDFTKCAPDFDIEKVGQLAKESGIELVGHHETVGFVDNYERQMEEAYKFYASHDIKYVKSGYAGSMMEIQGRREFHHSQLGVLHYQRAVELAAKYKIMLDIHEPIKGTGIERTWPNILTKEGARGQEYEGGALLPSHATYLPFTRLLAGGMDYTSGIFDIANATKRIATTIAKQLAYFVTIPSGMQMAADRPKMYEGELAPMFEFIRDVPVNWEKSVPLAGEIGEYYVIARKGRGEENWYIGGVTNENSRGFRITLDFLDEKKYQAKVYRDGENAHYRDNPLSYKIDEYQVAKNDTITVYAAPGGGFAIELIAM